MADLEISELSKSFPTSGAPLEVLRGTSLHMQRGENMAIVGPSGSGKSTLLHIVGTLDTPTAGQVELFGENPFSLSEPALASFRNRHIGFVFQEHFLLPQLTVWENVLIPALANGTPSATMQARATMLVERVGLASRSQHRPAELSGGERQRVAVARALLHQPGLILADEPTGSLDRSTALSIAQLLLELQRSESAMLITVTHSHEIAALFSQRLVMNEGKLSVLSS